MAVVVPAGFTITSQDPIDSRITVVDQNARLALNEFNVYPASINSLFIPQFKIAVI